MQHFGIDIYSGDNSPPPNFKAAYDDLKGRGGGAEPFLIIKATEGTNYMNPFFAANLADAKKAGFIDIAAYHFFHPSVDAGRQVAFFRAAIGLLPGVLDDEAEDGLSWSQISTAVNTFLRTPSELADQHYLNGNFLHNESGVLSTPLWWPIASGPTPPGTWITQDQGMVAGFAMLMDVDRWVGTEDQFKQFFQLADPPPPPDPRHPRPGARMIIPSPDPASFHIDIVDISAEGKVCHASVDPYWTANQAVFAVVDDGGATDTVAVSGAWCGGHLVIAKKNTAGIMKINRWNGDWGAWEQVVGTFAVR